LPIDPPSSLLGGEALLAKIYNAIRTATSVTSEQPQEDPLTQSSLLMLSWATCGDDGHWSNFLRLKLDNDSLSKRGVHVIWSEDADGSRKAALYVGQGKPVAKCLARHKDEATITQYERNGRVLCATWAKLRKEQRGGVARYLADTLRPLEGDRWSSDSPVPVNLPW
jgi:hypothetical protein